MLKAVKSSPLSPDIWLRPRAVLGRIGCLMFWFRREARRFSPRLQLPTKAICRLKRLRHNSSRVGDFRQLLEASEGRRPSPPLRETRSAVRMVQRRSLKVSHRAAPCRQYFQVSSDAALGISCRESTTSTVWCRKRGWAPRRFGLCCEARHANSPK